MKKLLAMAVSAMIFSLMAVGCSEEKSPEEDSVSMNSIEQGEEQEQGQDKDEAGDLDGEDLEDSREETREDGSVKVFLPSEDATELIEVDVEAENGRPVEEIVIDELRADRDEGSVYTKAIRDDIDVKSVRVEGDMAIVDFSSQNLHGGSAEESFIINSVVKSLLALDGIERVQFLVDGEIRDTLMGHYEIEEPYTLSDLEIRVN